jgi:hypothetical protein
MTPLESGYSETHPSVTAICVVLCFRLGHSHGGQGTDQASGGCAKAGAS